MPAPDHARIARGADRPVAELPPPPAGDPLRSMSRSWRTICASRSPAWSTRGSPPMKRSWWRSSAWATSTPCRGSSRASTRTACGSSSSSSPSDPGESRARARTDAIVAFCLAVAAAVAIKVPALFGMQLDEDAGFYARNASLFVLPLLTGYFVWKRRLDASTVRLAGRWRSSRRVCSPTSIPSPRRAPPRSLDGAAPADRALAGGGHRVRRRPLEPGRGPHGLHPLLGRALHLLRADRPRRRRPHRVHGDDLPGHRDRRRAASSSRGCCRAARSGPCWSPPGWWRPSRA